MLVPLAALAHVLRLEAVGATRAAVALLCRSASGVDLPRTIAEAAAVTHRT